MLLQSKGAEIYIPEKISEFSKLFWLFLISSDSHHNWWNIDLSVKFWICFCSFQPLLLTKSSSSYEDQVLHHSFGNSSFSLIVMWLVSKFSQWYACSIDQKKLPMRLSIYYWNCFMFYIDFFLNFATSFKVSFLTVFCRMYINHDPWYCNHLPTLYEFVRNLSAKTFHGLYNNRLIKFFPLYNIYSKLLYEENP